MRGFGTTFSRLPAARAFIAGAAILAGAAVTKAEAQTQTTRDDIAFAIPRVESRGFSGVALPQPLPPSEATRISKIFVLQGRGDISSAARETANIDVSTEVGQAMLGHILAQRYLGPSTRPNADELQVWLRQWPTLPDARAMHALLLTRLPQGVPAPPAPALSSLSETTGRDVTAPVPEESEPATFTITRNLGLDRSVHEAARGGGASRVQRLLAGTAGLTPVYASQLRGEAAQILFTLNRDAEAYALGRDGMQRCTSEICTASGLAGYIAGLAAWRMEKPDQARPMFEAAWRSDLTTPALRSAAAFWAARAQLRTGHSQAYQPWLSKAAMEPSTFYGLLARRTLGLNFGLAEFGGRDTHEVVTEADIEAVAATPEGLRAFALLQVSQRPRAEAELRQLWPAATKTPALGRAIMLVAQKAGLTQFAAQLADLVQSTDGRPRNVERFAVPRLKPDGGFRVDPAMVYGIARTESNFNTALVSNAGATGLMQIMPDTASFLTGRDADGTLRGTLRDPGFNLELGQRYVAYLAQYDGVNGDLLRLLASYNAGPGHFGRWSTGLAHQGDPLLFIEAIPIDETRAFVPRVLTYTWLYAARMHLPTPSLDELAAGIWPRYHELDKSSPRPIVLH